MLTVIINDHIVGHADALDVNMPWFFARFEPVAAFEEWRGLFEAIHQAYEDGQYAAADQLDRELEQLTINLVNKRGEIEYTTHPTGKSVAPMNTVRIWAGRIMWRPGQSKIELDRPPNA